MRYLKFTILFVVFIACQKHPDQVVVWQPAAPVQGNTLNIKYNSGATGAVLVESDSVLLVGQVFFNKEDSVFFLPMNQNSKTWEAQLELPDSAVMLSVKFEDNILRTDHNKGRGWSIFIRLKDGGVAKNSHYWMGEIYKGTIRPEAFPYYKKAVEEYAYELTHYPDNYKSLVQKWMIQLKLDPAFQKIVSASLDSIVADAGDNKKFVKLAFDVNLKLLYNYDQCLVLGEKFSQLPGTCEGMDEVAFALLHIKHGNNMDALIHALEIFAEKFPESPRLSDVYNRLADLYYRKGYKVKALSARENLNRSHSREFPVYLNLASIEVELGNYEKANEYLVDAEQYLYLPAYRIRDAWQHPGNRSGFLNLDLCQLYSMRAHLNEIVGDYDLSIHHRTRAIDLGSPFPAFEWNKIGIANIKQQKMESAKIAFLNSLAIDPDQSVIRKKLKEIRDREGLYTDFDNYVEETIKVMTKSSDVQDIDFEAISLDNERLRLSEQKGKVVVLCFWDSQSRACFQAIPEMNELTSEYYNNDNVKFWAISNEGSKSLKLFLKNTEFKYTICHSGSSISEMLGISTLPTHIVVSEDGITSTRKAGYVTHLKQQMMNSIELVDSK